MTNEGRAGGCGGATRRSRQAPQSSVSTTLVLNRSIITSRPQCMLTWYSNDLAMSVDDALCPPMHLHKGVVSPKDGLLQAAPEMRKKNYLSLQTAMVTFVLTPLMFYLFFFFSFSLSIEYLSLFMTLETCSFCGAPRLFLEPFATVPQLWRSSRSIHRRIRRACI